MNACMSTLENMHRYPADADYWLKTALVDQLELSTRYLIGERDALYDSCTDSEGNLTDPLDGEALAELDQLINDNKAALKAARREA